MKDFASHARSARCLLKMGRKPNSKVSRRSPSIPFQCPLRWRRRPHSRGVCGVPAITAASPRTWNSSEYLRRVGGGARAVFFLPMGDWRLAPNRIALASSPQRHSTRIVRSACFTLRPLLQTTWRVASESNPTSSRCGTEDLGSSIQYVHQNHQFCSHGTPPAALCFVLGYIIVEQYVQRERTKAAHYYC